MGRIERDVPALFEVGGQFLACAEEPGFHGSLGATHDPADFLTTEFLRIKQSETSAVFVSKSSDALLEFLGPADLAGRRGEVLPVFGEFEMLFPFGSISQRSPATVDGDGEQPRMEGAHGVPVVQASKRPEEDLLHDIFRILPMREHAETEAE